MEFSMNRKMTLLVAGMALAIWAAGSYAASQATTSAASPHIANLLGCGIAFAGAVYALIMAVGAKLTAAIIIASLGVGAALAFAIAAIVGAVIYYRSRHTRLETIYH